MAVKKDENLLPLVRLSRVQKALLEKNVTVSSLLHLGSLEGAVRRSFVLPYCERDQCFCSPFDASSVDRLVAEAAAHGGSALLFGAPVSDFGMSMDFLAASVPRAFDLLEPFGIRRLVLSTTVVSPGSQSSFAWASRALTSPTDAPWCVARTMSSDDVSFHEVSSIVSDLSSRHSAVIVAIAGSAGTVVGAQTLTAGFFCAHCGACVSSRRWESACISHENVQIHGLDGVKSTFSYRSGSDIPKVSLHDIRAVLRADEAAANDKRELVERALTLLSRAQLDGADIGTPFEKMSRGERTLLALVYFCLVAPGQVVLAADGLDALVHDNDVVPFRAVLEQVAAHGVAVLLHSPTDGTKLRDEGDFLLELRAEGAVARRWPPKSPAGKGKREEAPGIVMVETMAAHRAVRTLRPGSVLVISGENASGKSQLLRSISSGADSGVSRKLLTLGTPSLVEAPAEGLLGTISGLDILVARAMSRTRAARIEGVGEESFRLGRRDPGAARCEACDGTGQVVRSGIPAHSTGTRCQVCSGTGIALNVQQVTFRGVPFVELVTRPLVELISLFEGFEDIEAVLLSLDSLGLGQSTMLARAADFSPGILQLLGFIQCRCASQNAAVALLDDAFSGTSDSEVLASLEILFKWAHAHRSVAIVVSNKALPPGEPGEPQAS